MNQLIVVLNQFENAEYIAKKFSLPLIEQLSSDSQFYITSSQHLLQLAHHQYPKSKPFHIDFQQPELLRRAKFFNQELLYKALGLKKMKQASIIDATAGFGTDAFLMSQMSSTPVLMIERCPIIALLLEQALRNWQKPNNLQIIASDSIQFLEQIPTDERPDIIHIDAMYPHRKKSALNVLPLRLLRELVGDDNDAEKLFDIALSTAKNKVIVKRPLNADNIDSSKPNYIIKSKVIRYDIYLT